MSSSRSERSCDIVWEWLRQPGLEHLRLRIGADSIHADGLIVGAIDGAVFRLRYVIECDGLWQFREARLAAEHGAEFVRRHVIRDVAGRWRVDGADRPELAACADIDIMATPFTNTLPIRRVARWTEEPVAQDVAYVRVPDLEVSVMPQDYTRLDAESTRFRYRNLQSGFSAELSVDADGVVVEYGDIWRRRTEQCGEL